MVNTLETNGAVTRMQNLKSSENNQLDANNNDKYLKDRNVPSEYKFNFDTSSKFNYLNKNESNNQENEKENFRSNNPETSNYPKSTNQNLKPLGDSNLKNKNISSSHYYSHGNSGAIKRGCEDVDNENEDDLATSISSSTGCSRRSPPKKPKFVVTSEEMNEYFNLLHQTEIQLFLKRDACCLISDKYALAMVFTYFKRANFNLQEYTKDHFYLALYLASDIEEDVDEYKYEIFPWALGNSWRSKFSGFLRRRDALLRRIGYRAIVSRKCCEEVMSFKADHCAWKRERAEDHGGATRAYLINRSKRFLMSKTNLEDDELNLPRLPEESPRPCPLCLINRGWNNDSNSINLPEQKPKITLAPTAKPEVITNYNTKSYNLTKRHKSNDYSKEITAKTKTEKLVKTPPQKKDYDSNSDGESETSSSNIDIKKDSKIPAANKFLKVKLSTTELENHHRSYVQQAAHDLSSNTENSNFSFVNYQRHSSLVSADKFLIKDSFDTSDDDSLSEDDVFSVDKNTTKSLIKKQELLRINASKLKKAALQQNAPVRKRTSLSNASNYNLRSHSVNAHKNKNNYTSAKLQMVPLD